MVVIVSFMLEPNFRALLATTGLKTRNIISVRNDPSRECSVLIKNECASSCYRCPTDVCFEQRMLKMFFYEIKSKDI